MSADQLWPLLEAIVEFGRVRKKAIASCEGHVRRTHQSRATDGVFVVKELAGMSDWAASICARRLSSGSLEMVLARAVS
jgi:hypothetical protein